jgi:PhoH-like ATPase
MPLPKAPSKPATILELPAADAPPTLSPPDAAAAGRRPEARAGRDRFPAPVPAVPPRAALAPAVPVPVERGNGALRALPLEPAEAARRKPKLQAVAARRRLFVLDTNVLMHDPTSLFRFEEHDLFLPMMTLEELDGHKKGMSEVARNARQASRSLDALVAASKTPIEEGIALNAVGNPDATGRLYLQTQEIGAALPASLPVGRADNHILSVVRALKQLHPDRDVVLVSKDINMRVKARALDLPAEDYFNDKVLEDTDLLYTGVYALPANFWDRHAKGMESWQQSGTTYYRVTGPVVPDLLVNQFVYLEEGAPFYAQVREIRGRTAVLRVLRDYLHAKNAVWGITARNREQSFAMNLLCDPDCDFISLIGQAGTGKTLLALAAGLAQTFEAKRFTEIIFTRATVPVGEDIGFLPGTEEEKMAPWMGALEDNLEVLNRSDDAGGEWGRAATNDLIRTRIRIKSMSFMRGRTFINKFLIIDEAQNLTPKQMKTLVTRAGPGTKVVCLGNIAQIDTPYLTEGSSGLTYVVDRFKGWLHAGHVTLQRGERSRLADYAAEAL